MRTDVVEAITRAARIRDRKRRTGFNREQVGSRDERPGAGRENRDSGTRLWAVDATTFIAQRISRDRLGLAGVGTQAR